MRHFLIVLTVVAFLGAPGCDVATNTSESEALTKLRSGQYTLISNQELAELKHDAELGKSVGRYQIHREGIRTWRLDTATGRVCILLTTGQDWKKPDVKAEACDQ